MILENIQVKHSVFGDGVVTATNGKYFTVKFSVAEKVFVYPDVFERFLTLADGTISDAIREDIEAEKVQRARVAQEKRDENRRAMERGIVIPGKEIMQEPKEDETASEGEEV